MSDKDIVKVESKRIDVKEDDHFKWEIQGVFPKRWEEILSERLDKIENSIAELQNYIETQNPLSISWTYRFEENNENS